MLSSMTPSAIASIFDRASSGIERFVAVKMKIPPAFLIFAPRTCRKLMQSLAVAALKMGVTESKRIVMGPLALSIIRVTCMLTSVKSVGSLMGDPSTPAKAEYPRLLFSFGGRRSERARLDNIVLGYYNISLSASSLVTTCYLFTRLFFILL